MQHCAYWSARPWWPAPLSGLPGADPSRASPQSNDAAAWLGGHVARSSRSDTVAWPSPVLWFRRGIKGGAVRVKPYPALPFSSSCRSGALSSPPLLVQIHGVIDSHHFTSAAPFTPLHHLPHPHSHPIQHSRLGRELPSP
jgi:hypothetical protein